MVTDDGSECGSYSNSSSSLSQDKDFELDGIACPINISQTQRDASNHNIFAGAMPQQTGIIITATGDASKNQDLQMNSDSNNSY